MVIPRVALSVSSCLALAALACAQAVHVVPSLVGQAKLEKLVKKDIKVGSGPAAESGDVVYVLYRGTFVDGKEFESNYAADKFPYSFRLGEHGTVISGWQIGIAGMKVGGVRRLEIPAEQAYGAQGNQMIPPNTDLYFEIKLIGIVKKGEEGVYDKRDIKVGTGRVVKAGDLVEVTYVAKLLNNRVFDRRSDPKQAVVFRVSDKKLKPTDRLAIPGVRAGVIGMREGGTRELRLPPALAFNYNQPGGIPPQSFVIFEVTVRRIR